MNERPLTDKKLRLRALPKDAAQSFELRYDAAGRAAVAKALGIPAIRKLRFAGRLIPEGRADWRLEAELGATAVQSCVVTLEPVTTRIDTGVARTFLADPPPVPDSDEIEMPEDDSLEPLPAMLDLEQVMIEALALALPDYPRADGVEPFEEDFARPGAGPEAEDEKPFAGLAGLRDKLGGKDDD